MIADSTFTDNDWGITLMQCAALALERTSILRSGQIGVSLAEHPCHDDVPVHFTGHITGFGNTGEGTADGDYCPNTLAFLFTEEGGELDRREEE